MKNTRCFEIWSLKLGHVWESWRNTRGHIFSNRCSQCLTHFAKVEKTFDRFLQDKPQELTMSLSTLVSLKMTLTWLWNILRWHFDSDPCIWCICQTVSIFFTQIFCTKFHHQLWYKVEELVNFQEGGMTFREIMTRIKARSAPFRSIRVGRNVGEVKLRFERWRKIKIWGISWKLMETDGNWWKLMEYVWLIWLYDYVVIQTHQKK